MKSSNLSSRIFKDTFVYCRTIDLISRLRPKPRRRDFTGKNIPEFLSGAGARKVAAEAAGREAGAGAQGKLGRTAAREAGAGAAPKEPSRGASQKEHTSQVPQEDMKRPSEVIFVQLVVNTVRLPPRHVGTTPPLSSGTTPLLPSGTTPPLPSGTINTILQAQLAAGSAVLRPPLLAVF